MKSFLIPVLTLVLFLVGCDSGSSTSSTRGVGGISLSNESAIELPSGALIHVEYASAGQVGVAHDFIFRLRSPGAEPGATTGTVHWDDFTDTRIRDDRNVVVSHTYYEPGNYRVAVVIDGDEKVVVANVAIGEDPAAGGLVASAASNIFSGFSCSPGNGSTVAVPSTSTLTLPGAFTDGSSNVPVTCTVFECTRASDCGATVNPGDIFNANTAAGPIRGCNTGTPVSVTIAASDGSGSASCSWTVQ